MRFRNRIRDVRLRRGLTAVELAALSGVSRQTITALERDDGHEPRGAVQVRLCEALNDTGLFWVERGAGDPPAPAEEGHDDVTAACTAANSEDGRR